MAKYEWLNDVNEEKQSVHMEGRKKKYYHLVVIATKLMVPHPNSLRRFRSERRVRLVRAHTCTLLSGSEHWP